MNMDIAFENDRLGWSIVFLGHCDLGLQDAAQFCCYRSLQGAPTPTAVPVGYSTVLTLSSKCPWAPGYLGSDTWLTGQTWYSEQVSWVST